MDNLIKRHCRRYPAENDIGRAVVIHGILEHSGRYRRVTSLLNRLGFSVCLPDLTGHGKSPGRRGHIDTFQTYLDDVKRAAGGFWADNRKQNKLNLLIGHSMGGLVALTYALRYPGAADLLILSSPALGIYQRLDQRLSKLARFLGRTAPGVGIPALFSATFISHDANVVLQYKNDPLIHSRITFNWLSEMARAMGFALRNADGLKIPVLIQAAGDDKIVDVRATGRLFKKIGSTDKKLVVYPDCYHEIFNETPALRTPVFNDMESWLRRRI